jgi:anti-sigma regulatory factor (Ser/Thr protein kinase)
MWIREVAEGLPGECIEDLLLIVSELIANNITQAAVTERDQIDLIAHVSPDVVRVCVRGRGIGLPDDWRAPAADGLRLVERLADRLILEPTSGVITMEMRPR